MNDTVVHEIDGSSIVIRPNRSLPAGGVVVLFLALSTLILTVSISFAVAGAWMVLPFAAMEIILVGSLCRWLYRHMDDCELVVVEPQRVRVIKRSGTKVSQDEFTRYWVRMNVAGTGRERRLWIGSHGRLVSLADGVSEADRLVVARELKSLLRSGT